MKSTCLLIDKIKERNLKFYRRNVFLSGISSSKKTTKIWGKVFVNAANIKIGKKVTIYPNVVFWGDGEIKIGAMSLVNNDIESNGIAVGIPAKVIKYRK